MTTVTSYLGAWFKKPFDPNGSVVNWALFVLLILLLAGIWANVLSYIVGPIAKAAKEAV